MCSLGFHNCQSCGEEYKCDQPNSECPVYNHYETPCQKCEYWDEMARQEQQYDEDRAKERDEWIRDNGWDYET